VPAQLPPIEAHDVLVKSGGMSQILLWTSFLEIFGGIALFQTIQGKRYPGDFQFDPLGLSQVRDLLACRAVGVVLGEVVGVERGWQWGKMVISLCVFQ
jgi:hypothetical protein